MKSHNIHVFTIVCWAIFLPFVGMAQSDMDVLLGKKVNPKFEKAAKIAHTGSGHNVVLNYAVLTPPKTKQNFYYREKNPDNLWGIDFFLYSISGHYARKISKELYIGLEAGVLPAYNWIILAGEHFTKENTVWSSNRNHDHFNNSFQLSFGHLFARWRPKKIYLEIDGGFRAAIFRRKVLYIDDRIGRTEFYGAYIKPMIRIYKFSIGGRVDIGNMYSQSFKPSPEFIVIASPVLRFNFK